MTMKKTHFKLLHIATSLVIINLLFGCAGRAKLVNTIYFNERSDSLKALIVNNYEPVIQPGDRLKITITALDPLSVAPYQKNMSEKNVGIVEGYEVENDGKISIPQLGKINVAGLKRSAAADTIANRISKFVDEPTVNVQFLNFKVTIMGEVNQPSVQTIADGKTNILEAIGLAGEITQFGRKDNIMVIREVNGKREFGTINLLSMNIFNSPYYNLHQNDIIYVEPVRSKSYYNDQALMRNLSVITSVLSVISTIFILIINITK